MKYLTSYESYEYVFESDTFQYTNGCIMLELPIPNWNEILDTIDKDDIYDVKSTKMLFGLQKNPHLTLLYPIQKNLRYDKVKRVLDREVTPRKKPISLHINSIELFEANDYDILVFRVDDNNYLSKLHTALKDSIPNYNKHKDFKLHITIGYLKKGTGSKYCGEYDLTIDNITEITYNAKSSKDTYEIEIY